MIAIMVYRRLQLEQSEIERRHQSGESFRSIARSLGITHQALAYHRRRWGMPKTRSPRTGTGPEHPSWKGGRYVEPVTGYIMVLAPREGRGHKYIQEHILVAEATLGRRLVPGEIVHHINAKRQDNRPENLWVFRSHSEHRKAHHTLSMIALRLFEHGDIEFSEGTYRLRAGNSLDVTLESADIE